LPLYIPGEEDANERLRNPEGPVRGQQGGAGSILSYSKELEEETQLF
jgi:hypothetical protein